MLPSICSPRISLITFFLASFAIKGFSKNWKYLTKIKKVNRQNYEKFYFINGSLYFFTIKFFQKYKKFYNFKSFAYKVDKINFVDIDTSFDLEVAKKLINTKTRN